ncbi:hypothetical protein TBLA_0A04190 [Henningerozyma blattae CBS 6284]|uniref:Uncharacterized protein n=1 Tax=Henningerozyma blattae (strain ATCC 34711 / CBS 6284 / DSM 70876 / NBRC 10599 / NRRL Y-10934 / UCD 77-7) TaxID=1071380 RepID=I2GVR3_HENB6|nr:hypothetical protein TBLA_0A04190 [Tetrapisispora blattae CBS 6284]CCH58215.1 hypothetical protein TBLA_0A04190 [Tetrapisispora blattae CBS 6284]
MENTTITPGDLSAILRKNGPLAIRHITKEINKIIPNFDKLSSSKQRRLIINTMELGDIDNLIIFEKVGWGQWNVKYVPNKLDFFKLRDEMNKQNLNKHLHKLPTSTSTSTITSTITSTGANPSTSTTTPPTTSADEIHDSPTPSHTPIPKADSRIDSDVIVSEDEESDSEADSAASDDDTSKLQDNLFTYGRRRKSSVVFDDSTPTSPRLPHMNINLSTLDSHPIKRRHSSSKPEKRLSSREARLSFSKESSLRSTLLDQHNKRSYISLQNARKITPHLTPLTKSTSHSETDEEDWKSIGAESLRKNSVAFMEDNLSLQSIKSSSDIDQSTPPLHPTPQDNENDAARLLLSLKS